MKIKLLFALPLLGSALGFAPAAAAQDDAWFVSHLSPYVGTGASDLGKVSYANGLSLSADARWEFLPGWTLGPRVEFLDATIGSDFRQGTQNRMASFENRIWAGGLRLGFPVASTVRGYVLGMGGRGNTHVQVNQSQDHSFAAFAVDNVTGSYAAVETGAEIRLHRNLGLQLGLLASRYVADFSDADVNADAVAANPTGGLTLRGPDLRPNARPYPDKARLDTYALKLGVAMHF